MVGSLRNSVTHHGLRWRIGGTSYHTLGLHTWAVSVVQLPVPFVFLVLGPEPFLISPGLMILSYVILVAEIDRS